MDVFPGWASEGNGVYLIYCLSTKTIFIYRQNVAKILKQINHPESSTVQLLREKWNFSKIQIPITLNQTKWNILQRNEYIINYKIQHSPPSRRILKIIIKFIKLLFYILQFHIANEMKYPFTTRNNNIITPIFIEISKIVIPRSSISRIAGFQIERQLERTPMAINLFHNSHFQI